MAINQYLIDTFANLSRINSQYDFFSQILIGKFFNASFASRRTLPTCFLFASPWRLLQLYAFSRPLVVQLRQVAQALPPALAELPHFFSASAFAAASRLIFSSRSMRARSSDSLAQWLKLRLLIFAFFGLSVRYHASFSLDELRASKATFVTHS